MGRPPNRSPHTRAVLAALLDQPARWRHGYDLSRQTGLQSGTLYPILIRLAAQGLLEDNWEPGETPGKPLRHIYRLSAAGVAAAREMAPAARAGRLKVSRATS